MENNLENKSKYFAQHWGQRVFKLEGLTKIYSKPYDDILQDDYLELKPLSSITDEDCIHISTMCYRGKESHTVEAGKNIAFCLVKEYSILHVGEVLIFVTDYLRSKSYALPYMGLSVEKLIEYGWLNLSE